MREDDGNTRQFDFVVQSGGYSTREIDFSVARFMQVIAFLYDKAGRKAGKFLITVELHAEDEVEDE